MFDSAANEDRGVYIAAVSLAALLLSVDLLLPLGFDNDIYQSMGWVLYAYHGLPYLASWDHNFPGIVYIHALGIALFGNSDLGFRLVDTIFHIAIAATFYKLLRRWVSPLVSFLAVILLTSYYTGGQWDLVGQRDGYALFFLLLGALLLFRIRDRRIIGKSTAMYSLLLGIAQSAAILMRPTYGLFAIAVGILLLRLPKKFATVPWYVAGALIPFACVLVPYAFVRGGLTQIYDSLIRFNLELYSGTRVPVNLLTHGRGALYLLAIIGVLSGRRKGTNDRVKTDRFDGQWLIYYIACSLLSPIVMGKYFIYHFVPFMAIVIAFSAIGCAWILERVKIPRWIGVTIVILLAVGYFYPRHLLRYYVQGIPTGAPLEYTYRQVLSDSLIGLRAQEEVIEYLDRRIRPNDPIEYPSYFLGLDWRSERPEATRFTMPISLTIAKRDGTHPAFQNQWRQEFIDSIKTVRPQFVVLRSGEQAWWPFIQDSIDAAVHKLPEFKEVLSSQYVHDTTIRGFTLYRLKS